MRSQISAWLRIAIFTCVFIASSAAQQDTWHFAVSGDSRNCGDVVMPAIAKGAVAQQAAFYWHLGDFRAIYRVDQDYWQLHQPSDPRAMNISAYLANAWRDFIDNQIKPFGDMPVYLAFGNHELIPPMTREQLMSKFNGWLDAAAIREQRLKDDPQDQTVRSYYHWMKDGIDFLTLDNAASQFEEPQMRWIHAVLEHDEEDSSVRAIVLGMHEALSESISKDHSMNQSLEGEQSGKMVYRWLLDVKQRSRKPVYVLSSHSHYYMGGIFNTQYWRTHGGVLPGWIIGTAGAERYTLPEDAKNAKDAKAHIYGYLLATVSASKENPIIFEFHELKESDVPPDVVSRFTSAFVHECWVNNPVQ